LTSRLIFTLIPVSLIYGLAAALAFRRLSDEASIRVTINRMMAHVLEFRLFLDSPALVLRAQRDLARENLRLLRLILLPCATVAVIFIALYPQLDALYGHAPLNVGEPSIVTAQFHEAATLEAPVGIVVETPGVRNTHDREVSWRVRPLGRTTGELKIRYEGGTLTKRIVAGDGLVYASFSSPAIKLQYPRTTVLGANWMVWFFIISTATAIGYKQ
jgi:hypothetical protein